MAEAHHHPKPSESSVLRGDVRGGERKGLVFALTITIVVMAAEVAGGLLAGSLALLSDALHMLTDAGSIVLSYAALRIATAPASPEKTYRNWRYEVIAALFNGLAFLPIAGWILWEAYHRWTGTHAVDALPMLGVGLIGLAANLVCMGALHRHSHQNVNLRGAFLHVLGDAVGSVGVVVAAGILLAGGPAWIDPLVAGLIAVLVLVWSVRLVRDALRILLEAVPSHVRLDDVRDAIVAVEGVADIHDLHVWTITSKMYALTAHVRIDGDRPVSECQDLCARLSKMLDERFDINHVTLQLETTAGETVCCELGGRHR